MHDKNARLYYWYPSENWPPESVQEPGEIRTDGRLSVWCTQTSRSANDQRKLVARWCDTLPNLRVFDTFGFVPGYPNDCLMQLAKFQASNRFT